MAEHNIGFSKHIPPGWYPWKLSADKKQLRWVFLGEKKFTESFFEETISSCLHLEENSSPARYISSISSLPEVTSDIAAAKPTALIFHISRCGSTLLSQLLAMELRNIVLSEVPVLDQMLEFIRKEKLPFAQAEKLVTSLIRSLGRKRSYEEEHLFIKLDSWHIFYYPLLRKIFPGIPFLLLYRSPNEVYRSHKRRSGMHMVPGFIDHELLNMSSESSQWTQARFGDQLLSNYLREYIRISEMDPLAYSADYSEGIENITWRLLDKCGIVPDADFVSMMHSRMEFHSKNPGEKFSGDPEAVGKEEEIKDAMKVYHELEKIRKADPSSVE